MREREQRGELCENWWNALRSRVMGCEKDKKAACSIRREALLCWN